MKKIIFIWCLIFAQATAIEAQTQQQIRQILDKTAATVCKKSGTMAKFTIEVEKQGKTSGEILLKGKMFRITTPEALMWFDGKTQWTYLKNADEVNLTTPTAQQQGTMNPYAFVSLYKKGYTYSMKKDKKGNYIINLKAQNAQSHWPEACITISKTTYIPLQIKMRQRNNNWTNISISDFKAKNLSGALFKFDAKQYPSAEIIDLR